MQIGVHRARKTAPQQLRRFEIQLESGNEVDVQRVEIPDEWPELGPGPGRDAAGHLLAAPLCRFVPQRDAIVWFWHLEKTCVVRRASECAEERVSLRREIPAYLDKRDDLPVIRQGRIERGQRIGDATPLLDRRLRGIAAVNRVPHHGPDDAESLQRKPQCFWMNTAAAP